ncbi:DNA -binding domain-containing protein [Sphingosinicella microcystinivorans]|uniref:Uncharacterized protein DUF2285 n=1 Tax=Sphingosinicella microcystinivorans TaxID=335406 RepID=A0AAD1D7J3_SPHMI|nr:DUF2285 domain-containing protein [Sphingosinicella microcystinivorans]RKS92234.1 uncharacterized protein DUF2285 [Sphingosinicella microcystinivorans]BBE35256.1 hypothetical protein SmB9_29140 [Sphingosinicella microcystinivorans]
MSAAVIGGDWQDAARYTRLLPGDRRCFAWEWLRRAPTYAEAWAGAGDPAPFGLLRLEDPVRDALSARPLWNRGVDSAVLRAVVEPGPARDRLDLRRFAPLASHVADAAGEHVLLSDGLRSIRLDVVCGSLVNGPAMPSWRIDGLRSAGLQLHALRQLAALARHGRFARSLHPPQRRAHRWIAMLRVHDAIAAGATHREIVAGLFGIDVSAPGWRITAGPWRLRVQHLAATARAALARGPVAWLGCDED